MLLSFSAEFRGFRRGAVVYPSLPVVSRRLAVAYPSLTRRASVAHPSRRASVAEPDGSKEPVPYNGMRSGPSHPRVDAGLGHVPRPSCPGGLSMDSPSPPVCGRVYGDTLVQSFAFFNGGLAGFFLDGWSCCGLRRPSAEGLAWPAPLSRPHHPPTFLGTGGLPLYPRRGLRPLYPVGGRDGGSIFSPSAGRQGRGQDASAGRMVLLWPASSFSGGSGLAWAAIPPAPPSDVCVVGDTHTPGGNQGSLHPPLRDRQGFRSALRGKSLYPWRGLRPAGGGMGLPNEGKRDGS